MPKITLNPINHDECQFAIEQCRQISEMLQRASDYIASSEKHRFFVYSRSSFDRFLDTSKAVKTTLEESLLAIAKGDPVSERSTKGRKSSSSLSDKDAAMIAAAGKKIAADAAKTKPASPKKKRKTS